jgi:AcrR family transcriptional regulator
MAPRGPYAKGVAKRAEILDAALEVIARNGYSGATVKQLADAVGLSQNGLLHYFGSKDALFVEIVRHHSAIVELEVDPEHTDFSQGLATRILDAATASLESAGMSQLLLNLSTAASETGHSGHDFVERRYEAFRETVGHALRQMRDQGHFPQDGDPAACAAVITAAFDGLQLQWLYDRSLDVRSHLAYLLRALGVVDR